MARLDEITEHKNTILQRLVGNQEICKAVFYQDKNFLSKPDVKPKQVIYNNIYPFNYIPPTSEAVGTAKSYITISLTDYSKSKNSKFKVGQLIVRVFTHKDLFVTDEGALRPDFIVQRIDELLNEQRGIGIGELEFTRLQEIMINQDYLGLMVTYRPVNFN
ncbi:hypothetical protein D3C74_351650 [compost metagenome]